MSTYLLVKWLHILSSTLLFGTGIGSAFYLLLSSLRRDPRLVAGVARIVVMADWLFTATTVVFQPASGLLLVHLAGMPLATRWISWSLLLYAIALACWLPVVWLQMRMRDLAADAVARGAPLSPAFDRCLHAWIALGFPAFFAFVAIFYLMTVKPA